MTPGPTNPKEALLSEVQAEYDRIKLRLTELQTLIDQSQAEVKRLQQKSIDVTAQMNRLEANFDTVPRNDIKVIYTNAMDTKTRLLTMQSQLEKVQQDRHQLESFNKILERLLSSLQGVSPKDVGASLSSTEGAESAGDGHLSPETIIRIIESQEAERQRLARQMHDGPAQSLTNFILQAEICQRLFDRNPDKATAELGNLKVAASTTFQKVRDFIFDLRPMMLDDLGVAPTVRRYIDAFAEKSSIETQLNIVGEERRRLESHTEVMMFRSVQELLGYARDQAGATKTKVVLDVSSSPIKASVSFNGKSIDEIEASVEQSSNKVFGLKSLRERIELVGGTMNVYGTEGEENRVDITLLAGEIN
jgi:two-component system sensor histidine kinase DegS